MMLLGLDGLTVSLKPLEGQGYDRSKYRRTQFGLEARVQERFDPILDKGEKDCGRNLAPDGNEGMRSRGMVCVDTYRSSSV